MYRRPQRRPEVGQITLAVLVFVVAVTVLTLALVQVGEAGDQANRAQTAADAAALAGARSIAQQVRLRLGTGGFPFLGGSTGRFLTPADLLNGLSGWSAAASQYADDNGASLVQPLALARPTLDSHGTFRLAVMAAVATKGQTPPGPVKRGSGLRATATSAAALEVDLFAGLAGVLGPLGDGGVPQTPVANFSSVGQCVWYVAWRLEYAGLDYILQTAGLGDAGNWLAEMQMWNANHPTTAVTIDGNPAPGAVAVWTSGQIPSWGHVAVVDAAPNGASGPILVQDYNWRPVAYLQHTITSPLPARYIHFSDVAVASSDPVHAVSSTTGFPAGLGLKPAVQVHLISPSDFAAAP